MLTKKMCSFPHVRNFTLIYGPFSCLINVLFGPIFMENFVIFSNARTILELMLCNGNLTKLDILTLFRLQSLSSKIEQAFEKITKYVFVFILPTPTLTSFFSALSHYLKKKYFIY